MIDKSMYMFKLLLSIFTNCLVSYFSDYYFHLSSMVNYYIEKGKKITIQKYILPALCKHHVLSLLQ